MTRRGKELEGHAALRTSSWVRLQADTDLQERRVRLQDGTALLLAETHEITRGHVRICPSQGTAQAGEHGRCTERSRCTANAYMAPDAARGRAAVRFWSAKARADAHYHQSRFLLLPVACCLLPVACCLLLT